MGKPVCPECSNLRWDLDLERCRSQQLSKDLETMRAHMYRIRVERDHFRRQLDERQDVPEARDG